MLREASRHLNLADTDNWIATVGSQELKIEDSFRENGFTGGEIVIDFGPRQGGGGRA
jgi:hypothetical protein